MNRLDGIHAVSLDVGGTLIEPWPSVGHVYAKVAAEHGFDIAPAILNQRFATAWKEKQAFGHSMSDWSDLVDATFVGLIDVAPSQSFFPELYEAFARAEAWHIYDDVLPTLDGLRGRGIKLAAISNWDERLRPLLRKLQLDGYFEGVFVSIEIEPKPGAKIFSVAAQSLGVAPEGILHVGDSLEEDFHGARAAGFRALRLRRGKPRENSEQILSLGELISD